VAKESKDPKADATPEEVTCGLVMPISTLDGCSAEHWSEVKAIVVEAIESIQAPRFKVRLVSEADDIDVIQKRIVHNLYTSDIVVCDVSGKNPNVMFELGMRLAFDRVAVIVKDDKTDYSFDTQPVEHVGYRRDLRFSSIVGFQKTLADKVQATYTKSIAAPGQSPFLKTFGDFKVATIKETEAPANSIILDQLTELRADIQVIGRRVSSLMHSSGPQRRAHNSPPSDRLISMSELVAAANQVQSSAMTAELKAHSLERIAGKVESVYGSEARSSFETVVGTP
jgi:hypothetical protein